MLMPLPELFWKMTILSRKNLLARFHYYRRQNRNISYLWGSVARNQVNEIKCQEWKRKITLKIIKIFEGYFFSMYLFLHKEV